MELVTIDSVEHLLSVTSAPFPYNKSVEQTRWDPLAVLHTSGSTGTPKPIVVRQGNMHAFQKMLHMPKFHDSNFAMAEWETRANRLLIVMPMFHAAGTLIMLMPIFMNICTVMAISTKPLSINLALECLEFAEPDAALLPPSIIEGLAASEQGTKALAKLNFVAFGGGKSFQSFNAAQDLTLNRKPVTHSGKRPGREGCCSKQPHWIDGVSIPKPLPVHPQIEQV
jgi:acyl-CoA synthetase (AMP-forming)/AMP-acid ligase II